MKSSSLLLNNHNQKGLLYLLNRLPAMVYISDNSTKTIQWCNRVMEIETGYTLEEMHQLGLDFFRLIMHPDDLPYAQAAREHFLQSNDPFGGACRIRAKNQILWKWLTGIAIPFSYSADGQQVKEVVCVFQNLSFLLDTPSQLSEAFRDVLQRNHQAILETFTEREKEVLILLKEGNKAPAIAKKLFISYDTVQTHLHHLHEKMQEHTTAGLVRAAMEIGL